MFSLLLEHVVKTEAGDVVHLEDVMVFFSGASAEPPLGFATRPQVVFTEQRLARASTCLLELQLPLHDNYSSFKSAMLLSLKGHNGFGQI